MSARIVDVPLIRRLLSRHWPMEKIIARTGSTEEEIRRVGRNFEIVPVRTANGQMDWKPHKEDLRRFHSEGKTSQWVANHYGVSKNSIIGVWNRMDLPARKGGPVSPRRCSPEEIQKRIETRRRQKSEYARRKRAQQSGQPVSQIGKRVTQGSVLASVFASAPEAVMPAEAMPHLVVPILVRGANGKLEANEGLKSSNCRWWCGDPLDPKSGFCPSKAVVGLPYCEAHARRAFQPPTVRRPRAAPAPKPERIPTFADAESD